MIVTQGYALQFWPIDTIGFGFSGQIAPNVNSLALITLPDGTFELTFDPEGGVVIITFTNSGIYDGIYEIDPSLFSSGPIGATPPVIQTDGSPAIGETLTVIDPFFLFNGDTVPKPTPTYQWTRNSVAIPGATSSSYTLVSADNNNNIRVEVTLTDINGTRTFTSDPVPLGTPAEAIINSITYDTGGAVIDYTGALTITYDTAGALLEAT
ncbi:MAG: hypothetical protein AAF562_14815 [Pseudomonadota bacterium]